MATVDPAQLQRFIAAHPDVSPAQLQADLQRAVDYYAGLGYDVSAAADPSYYVQAALTGNTQAAATLPRIPTAPAPASAAPPPAYTPPAPAPPPAPTPTAPAAVAPLGTAGTTAQPTTALLPGSQTLFGPIVGTGDTGLPQGLGEEWHALFGQEMLSLMNATGQVVDPRTGAPLTNPDGTPLATQAALAQAAQIAAQQASTKFAQAALTGTIDGQPTLDAQRIQQQADQFAQQMGLSQAQLQAQISQFTQGFSLQQAAVTGTYNGAPTQAALALQAQIRQADQDLALRAQQLQQAQAQFQAAQSQQDQQYYANLTQQLQIEQTQAQFARDQLAQQASQFTAGQAQQQGQFESAQAQQGSQFGQSLTFQYSQLQQQIAAAAQQGDLQRANQLTLQANDLQAQAQRQGLDLAFQYSQQAQQGQQFGQTLAEQQRQFNTTQSGYLNGAPTLAAQQLLAANLADPTRTVQGAYLASQFGTARSGQAGQASTSGTPPASGSYPTAYATPGGTSGGGPGVQGVPVNVSPEVQSYFAGDPFATPRGQGQTMDLGALSGYAFKQAPSAYNALSATGRAQVGSFNQALTGQNPADYADMIARQLPRSGSSVPAAYSV